MTDNRILALKYRPQDFKDLIGQEVMAETITNAIKLGKTPNAYLLTGIRGVGKTTTARLIAKSLNCEKNLDNKKECSKEKFCQSCSEIINSNHIDVLEMDAASKTGIDDVRELIENSKYSPTSAPYKIFIIDEVHMLSKQAFNGLLKTLEEPPSRLKFILATTEARKIPVTILSRCQRFDLKRVGLEALSAHLKVISKKENGNITDESIKLISKASEGSVRDGVSLLDRALIFQSIKKNNAVEPNDVRQMLGLADKSKLLSLFKEVLKGNQEESLLILKELIDNGLDANNFLNDILEILYLFSRRINLGTISKDLNISESEIKLIDEYGKGLNIQDIGLFWQLTIKTIDDLKIISNENLALEMYIIQMIHLKFIEENENTNLEKNLISDKRSLNQIGNNREETNEDKKVNNNIKSQLKNTVQIESKTVQENALKEIKKNNYHQINTFKDIVELAGEEKEVELKYDLERNVKLVRFDKNKIDISFNEKLHKNFIKVLSEKLFKWTGERWIISLSRNENAKTIYEKNLEEKSELLTRESKNEVTKKLQSIFPDAKLIDVNGENDD